MKFMGFVALIGNSMPYYLNLNRELTGDFNVGSSEQHLDAFAGFPAD